MLYEPPVPGTAVELRAITTLQYHVFPCSWFQIELDGVMRKARDPTRAIVRLNCKPVLTCASGESTKWTLESLSGAKNYSGPSTLNFNHSDAATQLRIDFYNYEAYRTQCHDGMYLDWNALRTCIMEIVKAFPKGTAVKLNIILTWMEWNDWESKVWHGHQDRYKPWVEQRKSSNAIFYHEARDLRLLGIRKDAIVTEV